MKKIFFISCIFMAFISCKNDSKSESKEQDGSDSEETTKQNDGLTILKGEFIYYTDAAVLQTSKEIYGVVIDEKMYELEKQVKAYKKEPTDMVPVEIRGKIIPKPANEEGWPFRIEIKEILNVYQPKQQDTDVVKLNN